MRVEPPMTPESRTTEAGVKRRTRGRRLLWSPLYRAHIAALGEGGGWRPVWWIGDPPVVMRVWNRYFEEGPVFALTFCGTARVWGV
jgi:hypothetical protein